MNQMFALFAPLALLATDYPGLPVANGERDAPRQVRIEQHFSIRITPGTALPSELLFELEHSALPQRVVERPIGNCLQVGAIAGVKGDKGNRLLLILRDQRIISAKLQPGCRARDFYSGFYLERGGDGLICAGRDSLQSRSGANCQIRGLSAVMGIGR